MIIAAVVVAAAGAAFLALRPSEPAPSKRARAGGSAAIAKAPKVARPASEPGKEDPAEAEARARFEKAMAAQREANRRSVREAQETGRFPERLSADVPPKPFNRAAFEQKPQAYLDVVEPGRVHQTAEPGPDVPALVAAAEQQVTAPRKGSVTLAVNGAPEAPVTFTAFGPGFFDNGLGSVTVRADEDGYAEVHFTVKGEADKQIRVLVGSPMASAQVAFRIVVQE